MHAPFNICVALLFAASSAFGTDRLIIHEWGTFTSLEDENGLPIPGINSDDEPVPAFVHRVVPGLIKGFGKNTGKGIAAVHPDVNVRLETPVLYVHAPAGFKGSLDVSVKFLGGWLTEFYPDAEAEAPGVDQKLQKVGHLTAATVGTLHWRDLKIGGYKEGPATAERVWLAPRNVAAEELRTASGESEKFLFYRGVGNEGPVLSIARDEANGTLKAILPDDAPASVSPLPFWLADIRADGSVAYQRVNPGVRSHPFAPTDYSATNLAGLKSSMEEDLTGAGLYKDEAQALLNTWENSYFKSPGLRAFYLWPRRVTDYVLPLTVRPAADITRVMVGRIELVTPEQRATMERLGGESDAEAAPAYEGLGRFREALVLDEYRRKPIPSLGEFIRRMNVAYYQP